MNLARRQHSPLELLGEIAALRERGYGFSDIAEKTGLSPEYIHAIGHLLSKGEHRLQKAVERGVVPNRSRWKSRVPTRTGSRPPCPRLTRTGSCPATRSAPSAKSSSSAGRTGAASKSAGAVEARCLVAPDDEAFTYNKRISHLATIQEHYMIIKALAKGASEERVAASLNLDVAAIRRRRAMLNGICPEVVNLLKSRSVNVGVFAAPRRMKPLRQIEAVELMLAAGNVTSSYARVLLTGTRSADLVNADKLRKSIGKSVEQIEIMQREVETVQADYKTVEKSFGPNMLQLVLATGHSAP